MASGNEMYPHIFAVWYNSIVHLIHSKNNKDGKSPVCRSVEHGRSYYCSLEWFVHHDPRKLGNGSSSYPRWPSWQKYGAESCSSKKFNCSLPHIPDIFLQVFSQFADIGLQDPSKTLAKNVWIARTESERFCLKYIRFLQIMFELFDFWKIVARSVWQFY